MSTIYTYNGIATTTPKTRVQYEWEVAKNGVLKELQQDVTIKGVRHISAEYDAERNQTRILDRAGEDDKRVVRVIRTGVVLIKISTTNGIVSVKY